MQQGKTGGLGVAASPEEWREIVGFPSYRVSNLGRVRNVTTGRVLRPADDGHGYLRVNLGRGNHRKVHRLVCFAFHGDPAPGQEVAHLDGNRANAAAANLVWASPKENAQHKRGHGTFYIQPPREAMPRGEGHPHARLSDAEVAAIRVERINGGSMRQIAARHGVSAAQVCRIVNGKART